MLDQTQLSKIKEVVEEFFGKMTVQISGVEIQNSPVQDSVLANIKMEEPQILIGQQGQTLFEIQRLLRMILNKKLQKVFYLDLDINNYKWQKIEYLKDMAKSLADQVSLNRQEKVLPPMLPYERRIIHAELSKRLDVITESRGEGQDRHIVIRPK